MKLKHIISFSGGRGSYMAGKMVSENYGKENTICVFNDTLSEDNDTYRLLIQGAADISGVGVPSVSDLAKMCEQIPPIWERENRAAFLAGLAEKAMIRIPGLHWLREGLSLWEIFKKERFIGNTRADVCSKRLKREPFRKWIEQNFKPGDCIIYLGIDWTEAHRFSERTKERWAPYEVAAPLCDPPYISKDDVNELMKAAEIEMPKLYELGFSHNNCQGFCIKAGHGQFKMLLETRPEIFKFHEEQEQAFREHLGKDVAILRNRKGGTTKPLTLREFRMTLEKASPSVQLDLDDFGGCGCFID